LERDAQSFPKLKRCAAWFVGVVGASLVFGCANEKPQFDPVPEVSGLARRLDGCLLIREGWDTAAPAPPALVAFSWPGGKSQVVQSLGEQLAMSRISAPDRQETIAFMHADETAYSLHAIRIDETSDRQIFQRSGNLTINEPIGRAGLALSPRNGRIAFVGAGPSVQYPGADFVGHLPFEAGAFCQTPRSTALGQWARRVDVLASCRDSVGCASEPTKQLSRRR
jgi:hypothetical protein